MGDAEKTTRWHSRRALEITFQVEPCRETGG
jgi:hypothetical protein